MVVIENWQEGIVDLISAQVLWVLLLRQIVYCNFDTAMIFGQQEHLLIGVAGIGSHHREQKDLICQRTVPRLCLSG
jgi:hypothetical protein